MIAKVEAMQAWLENVTYQMCNMVSVHFFHIHILGCLWANRYNGIPELQRTIA